MPSAAAREIALCVRPAQGYCFCWEGFICLKPSKVKKAPPAADWLEGWGRSGLCRALFLHTDLASPLVWNFFLVLAPWHSWQLLALCAGTGDAQGLGLEWPCGALGTGGAGGL